THDLGVARYLAQDGVVLREGEVRERGPMRQLLTDPEDSYTRMLLESAMDIRPPEPGDPGAQGTPARESATPAERLEDPLVRARGLVKEFPGAAGPIRAVDDVSFELPRGGTLGIVGESGSGKSTLARLVLRLIDPTAGEVHVDGRDVLAMGRRKLRLQRRSMQMVFQSPYGSLLPASTVAENISEPLRINRIGTKRDRRREALDLLDRVQLPTGYADLYPRQLSGGEQQRVAIARALALEPGLLVADEPTSALDASVQAQVLELLDSLRRQLGFSILLITHNLAVVEKYTDHVMVMKSGRVVEAGTTADIFTGARHDYTRTLLDAVLPVHADALCTAPVPRRRPTGPSPGVSAQHERCRGSHHRARGGGGGPAGPAFRDALRGMGNRGQGPAGRVRRDDGLGPCRGLLQRYRGPPPGRRGGRPGPGPGDHRPADLRHGLRAPGDRPERGPGLRRSRPGHR